MKDYGLRKVIRLSDAVSEYPAVSDNFVFTGYAKVIHPIDGVSRSECPSESLDDVMPKVGDLIHICELRLKPRFLTTSKIRSIYVHESDDGYDKLVLPSDFPMEGLGNIGELKKGDILIATFNSVYKIRESLAKTMIMRKYV